MRAARRFEQLPFYVLRYPAYRRIWIGITASASGTWLRQLTASVLILDMTGSAALVGLVNVMGFLPILFLTLLGGRAVDRTSSRTVLIASQLFSGTASLVLAVLAFLDLAHTGVLLVAVFLIGAGYAFTKPATQALLPELVPPHALSDAVSVHSLQFTLGLAIGPVLAGVVLGTLGPGAAFTLDALSFFVLLAAAWSLPERPNATPPDGERARASISQAFHFVARRRLLVVLLVAMSCNTVAIEVVKTLMPVFAVRSFDLQAASAGLLIGVFGIGSLIGAAVGPRLEATWGVRAGIGGLVLLGVTVLAFSNLTIVLLGAALLLASGVGFMVANVVITSTFFRSVPAGMRGRVFSIHALSFLGISPVAALASGALAEGFGVSMSGTVTGAFALLGAGVLLLTSPEAGHSIARVDDLASVPSHRVPRSVR